MSQMWQGDQEADGRSDGGSDPDASGAVQRSSCWRRSSEGERATHAKLLEQAKKSGYVRAEIDGSVYELSEEIKLDKNIKHNIDIIVDRLIVKAGIEKRLTDSIETVLRLSDGLLDGRCYGRQMILISARAFPARTVGSALTRSSREAFLLTILLAPARTALGLGYKMEFDDRPDDPGQVFKHRQMEPLQ